MQLTVLPQAFSVCKVCAFDPQAAQRPMWFCACTDEELSLVCPTHEAPSNALSRTDGWRAFRIKGELDFSLIGILAGISGILAQNGIGIFVISTYNTDYVWVQEADFQRALALLAQNGYGIA